MLLNIFLCSIASRYVVALWRHTCIDEYFIGQCAVVAYLLLSFAEGWVVRLSSVRKRAVFQLRPNLEFVYCSNRAQVASLCADRQILFRARGHREITSAKAIISDNWWTRPLNT